MKGTHRSRAETKGSGALRRRCAACKKVRKFSEPPGDQGGEPHPRRPPWAMWNGRYICGWCAARRLGVPVVNDHPTR